ncbi:MAG: response regulator [Anaerolineae bacterium]|nr:response regulator [Anaerolineae bacterium]
MTKILVVDDEPFMIDVLQKFLSINNFETVGALNGEEALVLVKVEQPDAVILDLMLPDIEGYDVCARIRSYPETAQLPVIILSARTEEASVQRAMAAGATAYLTKPVKFPVLIAEIRRALSVPE